MMASVHPKSVRKVRLIRVGFKGYQMGTNLSVILGLTYDLNLLALGTFSPLNIRSAPTFLPLLGHPYLGPKTLFHNLQELPLSRMTAKMVAIANFRAGFIRLKFYQLNAIKTKNIIPKMQ